MKQPSRRKKENVAEIKGTGMGLKTCNECPFMTTKDEMAICNASDIVLGSDEIIKVPDWCGNKKGYEKGIQGKK